MKWEAWWEKSITRGTSGDMVMDILSDWKEERTDLLSKINELEEGVDALFLLIDHAGPEAWANGNVANGCDEGVVLAGRMIGELRRKLILKKEEAKMGDDK